MAMRYHSPASGVTGVTHTLHGPKKKVDPAIHHPQLLVAQTPNCPGWTLHAPHSQEVKLGRAEGFGLLPLLLGLVLEEQGCGTPASGGEVLWYPCKPSCSSFWRAVLASAPQLASELQDAVISTAICHNALSCLPDTAVLKGRAEPWMGAEGTHSVPQLPSMGASLVCKERVWADGTGPRRWWGCSPCTFQPLSLEHMSWLTPTELWPAAAGEMLFLQGCWSPHSGIPRARAKWGVRRQESRVRPAGPAPHQGVAGLALVTPGCSCSVSGCAQRHARTQGLCWTAQATNRFYQCRRGKHRASGTATWQLSDTSTERSGLPWELESWQMGPTEGRAACFSCSDISASSPDAGQPLSRNHVVHRTHCCGEATPELTKP